MYRYILGILVATVLALAGCTGGVTNTPVLPSDSDSSNSTLSAPHTGRSLWGYFNFHVDPLAVDPIVVTPVRSGDFHLNIRKYLEEFPCQNCISTGNIQTTTEGLSIEITIKHPFPPESGMYGFDVRGMFFFDGSMNFEELGTVVASPLSGDAYLGNADGYARIFNAVEFPGNTILSYTRGNLVPPEMTDPTATIGMYKNFFGDMQSEEMGGRRAFLPGEQITRRYDLVLPTNGPFNLGYAIDSSWDFPSNIPPIDIDDFPPTANCYEPFRLDVEEIGNSLTTEDGGVNLIVTAYDHQDAYAILECRVEAPGLTDSLIIDNTPQVISPNMALFDINIPNLHGMAKLQGEEILIEVTHADPDPNLGLISAWAFHTVSVTDTPPSPHVDGILPDSGIQDTVVDVTISGSGFHDGAVARLYTGILAIDGFNVVVVDPQTITASFDLTTPTGLYTVYVENPDSQWGELTNAFEVLP